MGRDLNGRITAHELNELHAIAEQKRNSAEESVRSFMHLAVELGEKLVKKKEEVRKARGHGHWLTWLSQNTKISERSAQLYMKAARLAKTHHVADLSLRQVAEICDRQEMERPTEEINPLTDQTLSEITWLGKWRDNLIRRILKTRRRDWSEEMVKDLKSTIAALHHVADRIGLGIDFPSK